MHLVILALACAPLQDQDGRLWSYFDSRESGGGPRLELETPGGELAVAAEADAVLLAYLPDAAHPRNPRLSVDLGDRNRVLIRWPLERGIAVAGARLVLRAHPSESWPPSAPFDVALHAVGGAWSEDDVRWASQPAFDPEPLARFAVPPEGGTIDVDVTALARAWAAGERENHGLLLRAAAPVSVPEPPPGPEELEAELWAALPWADSIEDALARAALEGKRVLVMFSASFGREETAEHERLLLATVLCHPAVRRAIEERCVPVRARVSPALLALASEDPAIEVDALAPLAVPRSAARPPALFLVNAEGELLGRSSGFAVCDHERVLALLEEPGDAAPALEATADPASLGLALLRAGRPAEAEAALAEAAGPEALYWRAALAHARGDRDAAGALLERVAREHAASPWALKARARAAWPDLVGGYEAIARPARPLGERALVERALEALREAQLPDGSFPMGHPAFEEHREGITALAALALCVHGEPAASEHARAWLARRLQGRDPAVVNSFTATYWLDLALERVARGKPRAEVEAGVALLFAGQLESGAWSYSRRFGETWRGGFGGWPVTERGRAHSMNTAIALEALTRAREAGFAVDGAALERGRDSLLAMRAAPAAYTYTWPDPVIYATLDASIARAPAAELALVRLGAAPPADLATAARAFVERRRTLLVPAQLSDSWLPPHALSGYFHSFGYYHAARAIRAAGGPDARADLARLRADVLARAEDDGTWVDTFSLGKPYGTAMALLVLWQTAD